MSINVAVVQGKGITYALAKQAGLSDADMKKVGLSKWTKVMDLVNQNQEQINKFNASNSKDKKDSIFTGGNDTSKIADKANWKTDFKVNAGQTMQIDSGIFAQIKSILTGQALPNKPEPIKNEPVKPDFNTQETKIPDKLEVPDGVSRKVTENTVDKLGGKIINREVNGEKKDISVVKIDGKKVRREVKDDGTLGDTLVPISTSGKNKYITQTEMDNRTKILFPNGLPKGITASFVSIGGTPTLVFKKDGKTLDQAGLRELAGNNDVKKLQSESDEASPVKEVPDNNSTKETENPSMSDAELNAYLDKDTTYQTYFNRFNDIDSQMKELETKYNMTRGDMSLNIVGNKEDYSKYSSLNLLFNSWQRDLNSYKTQMSTWQDGSLGEKSSYKSMINNHLETYSNLERITLKDGRRAWKTDQGVFLPGPNGMPGSIKAQLDE